MSTIAALAPATQDGQQIPNDLCKELKVKHALIITISAKSRQIFTVHYVQISFYGKLLDHSSKKRASGNNHYHVAISDTIIIKGGIQIKFTSTQTPCLKGLSLPRIPRSPAPRLSLDRLSYLTTLL